MTWMTQAAAKTIVQDRCQYLSVPALVSTDIDNVLAQTQRAQIWTASTAFDYGARVVPTVRNGFYMEAITAGTTGTTQPVWPSLFGLTNYSLLFIAGEAYDEWGRPYPDLTNLRGALRGVLVQDGTVQWQVAAPDWDNIYDLDAAAFEAWMLKAAKASVMANYKVDGQEVSREQVYKHCIEMAYQWAPMGVG